MLNADSRTLKKPSEAQSRRDPADDPDRGRLILDRADDGHEAVDGARGECTPQLLDEVARLGLLSRERDQREREEEERDEGEEREVGDHRREMRSTVCEELGDDAGARRRRVYGSGPVVALPGHGCRPSPRRPDRDLRADRGGRPGRRRRLRHRLDARGRGRRQVARRGSRASSSPPRTMCARNPVRSRSSRSKGRPTTARSSSAQGRPAPRRRGDEAPSRPSASSSTT